MYDKFAIFMVLGCLLLLSGCFESTLRDTGNLDALLSTVESLATANVASAPVNPYVFPIGVGLSGIIGIIEALRRKEKAGRKHAEQELNGNKNSS
jgi:uncharacterized membrane protein HdeD (DUF308 family)